MIAVGAGDTRSAQKAAEEARAYLGDAPLALLLSAQAAQLAGNGAEARDAFELLARSPETKILGLHGLYVEARRQDEHEAARHFAEQAAEAAPKIGWAGTALFEYQAQAGDWLGALRTLAANAGNKVVDRAEARRLRAVLLTARAIELEPGDPTEARAAALEAHRLLPALPAAAVVAARLLSRVGEIRRAARVLEQAWRVVPHPDIAEGYANVRLGDSVRDRLKRMRTLAAVRPNHPESAMAVARAAIDAHDWEAARSALDGLVRRGPTERVCLLMAEIEERQHGDRGRVRMWLTRAITAARDPAWVADGHVFERWAPVSPISGEVGGFEWTVISGAAPPREALEIQAGLEAEEHALSRPPEPPLLAEPLPDLVTPEPAPDESADADIVEPEALDDLAEEAAPPVATEPETAQPEPEARPGEDLPAAAPIPSPPAAEVGAAPPVKEVAPTSSGSANLTVIAGPAGDGDSTSSAADARVVPPSPDDPGPAPDEAEAPPARRRFGLF